METANKYLSTIEYLMTQNSRLTKELEMSVQGKLPSNVVSREIIDQCFDKIAQLFGPTAKGSILDEVVLLCDEFLKMNRQHADIGFKYQEILKEKNDIEKIVTGNDIDDPSCTDLISKVSKLRGVLEVIKTRLDRICNTTNYTHSEVSELRKHVIDFLNQSKS